MKTIIDISHHQKDFPWDRVKSEIDFVIVRPSHGINDTDKEWIDNLSWLRGHPDEKFAVYHYFYYKEKQQHYAELQNFLKHITSLLALDNFTGIAFLDFEHTTDIGKFRPIDECSPTEMTDYLVDDCHILMKAGFIPGLYASVSWLKDKMQPNRFPNECIIWPAHYDRDPGELDYPHRWDIHQYSSQGRLKSTDIFAGSLDMDYINPKTQFSVLQDIIKETVKIQLLKLGDISDEVLDIQQILKNRDYKVIPDRVFGNKTESAIKEFQISNRLFVDGVVGPQTWDALHSVREFSLARDGDKLVREDCPNFYVREFACKDGSDRILVCLINVKNMQKERNRRNRSMHVISGYRTPSHNKGEGGEDNSLHLFGYAADFRFNTVSATDSLNPSEIYSGLVWGHPGGLGRYRTFTHMDSGRRRRWYG